jgi:hypothetical protein
MMSGQAEHRFVEDQQIGLHHQGACGGQHLLLAAGQRCGCLRLPLIQDREKIEQPFPALGPVLFLEAMSAHVEILAHRHCAEEFAPLRLLNDSFARDRRWRPAAQRFAPRRMSPA